MEKNLVRASTKFKSRIEKYSLKTDDIQTALKQDEAAIEFINFNLFDKKKMKGTYYAALILKKDQKHPVFVPLLVDRGLLLPDEWPGSLHHPRLPGEISVRVFQ